MIFFCVASSLLTFNNCSAQQVLWKKILELNQSDNSDWALKKALILEKEIVNKYVLCDSVKSKIYHTIGKFYFKTNNRAKSIAYLNKAILLNIKDGPCSNKNHLAATYFVLADNYLTTNQYQLAERYFLESQKIWQKISPDYIYNRLIYSKLSSVYYLTGDYQKSLQFSNKAMALFENDIYNILETKILASQSLQKLNKLDEAFATIKSSEKIIKENNFTNTFLHANQCLVFGQFYAEKGAFNEAISYFLKSKKIYLLNNYTQGNAIAYQSIGELYLKINELHSALYYCQKALIFSDNNPILVLRNVDTKAHIFNNLKRYKEGLNIIQEAFGLPKNNYNQNPPIKWLNNNTDKEIYFSLLKIKGLLLFNSYLSTENKGDLLSALSTYLLADKLIDYMRRQHQGYQSKLYWRDKTHSLYENAIEVCRLLGDYETAFYFIEKSRAVLLQDKINTQSANRMLSSADQATERDYRQKIAMYNAQIEVEPSESNKTKLNLALLQVQENQQKFIAALAQKYPQYYAMKYDTSAVKLSDFRQYLGDKGLNYIAYFKGDSAQYQLWLGMGASKLIKQGPHENAFVYLQKKQLPGHRLLISEDGAFVPLDTLRDSNGRYLLEKYAFSYTYSAQYLMKKQPERLPGLPMHGFIGFAPVQYSSSLHLPKLDGANEALKQVSKHYFWPKLFEYRQAKKLEFMSEAHKYRVVQLFTHANADSSQMEPMVFFADSAMKVSELEGLNTFDTKLLVLSACKTNVGKLARGEGILSLARQFAALGIPATITTLWSVENRATYQITALFYEYLNQGLAKDLALQKAKLSYIENAPLAERDAIYWAAFVLTGDSSALKSSRNFYFFTLAAVAMLLCWGLVNLVKRGGKT